MKLQVQLLKEGYDAVFLAEYKNGKFHRVTHIRGNFNKDQFIQLMKIVPMTASHFPIFRKYWQGKVDYKEIVNSGTLYSKMMETYASFYEQETGIKAVIDGVAGRAMKQLITKLKVQTPDEDEVLAAFQVVLDNWGILPDFYQNQRELRQINSNINILLNHVKNGKSNSKTSAQDVSAAYEASNKGRTDK